MIRKTEAEIISRMISTSKFTEKGKIKIAHCELLKIFKHSSASETTRAGVHAQGSVCAHAHTDMLVNRFCLAVIYIYICASP